MTVKEKKNSIMYLSKMPSTYQPAIIEILFCHLWGENTFYFARFTLKI